MTGGLHNPAHPVRTATLVVAASNASALAKAEADYVCDGVADNVQIQAAIDALPASGGKVLLSEGTFTIAAAISIANRLILQGQGRDNTKIIQVAAAGGVNLIINGSGTTLGQVQIRSLTLDGNKTNCTVGKGIDGSGFQGFTLTDIRIQNTVEEGLYGAGAVPQSKNWFLYDVVIAASGTVGTPKDNFYWANGAGLAAFGFYSLTATKSGVQLASCNEVTLVNCWIDQCTLYGISLDTVGQTSVADCYIAANGDNGIYLSGTCTNMRVHDNLSYMNTAAGLYVSGTVNDGLIHHNQLKDNSGWGWRAPGVTFARTLIDHNVAQNNTSGNWSTTELGTGGTYRDNDVLIGPGEIRVASGALIAGLANAYAFNWQNPHASKILIKRVMIYLGTAGGTGTSVLDVGKAASTATHDDTLIDGLDLNTTGVFDNINDAGTNGKSRQLVDENGGTNDWVTGQILVANASNLVGRYEIEYVGV